jgi:hypothetical protein
MRERRVKSRSFFGLLATGPDGPSPLGHFRPSGTFSPLTAHKLRSADVMLTSAAILIKILFFFKSNFRNDLKMVLTFEKSQLIIGSSEKYKTNFYNFVISKPC